MRARKKRLHRYKFYIVNSSNIKKVFVYNKSFMSKQQAQEAIDAYLARELTLSIMSGTEVEFNKIPFRRSTFKMFRPFIDRRANVKDRINNYTKRERLKGRGLVTHMFKRQWKPMPTEAKARKALQLKGRDKIRNFILK